MSRIATVRYTGNLHSDLTHLQSGNVSARMRRPTTTAGARLFRPRICFAASLGACAMTIMG